ncbi:TPA: hypothetical protein SB533_001791 [Campylobacter coli]|nr:MULTISPECIES: hypothetical protein [Campylobacter]HEC2827706.1 hypothetical protein [Campylobacter jejuni]HEG0460125.1 hypothetical protein [Campylobacter coli]HEG0468841.1 hypothetical protein [Campylobacter coli]HEG0480192.1 hypothetical protein [Campylobacter coli]
MFETTKNLEYKKEALKIILASEGFKKLPYNDRAKNDNSGYLTIGYGINLQIRNWLIATLNELGLFGSVKDLKSEKDIEALDNKDNKAMIDEFYNITKQVVTDTTINNVRIQLNNLLKKYNGASSASFEITKEQGLNIKEIVSETIFNGVSAVNDKTLKMDEETNEYAGILSYAFNVGDDSRKYFFDICNKDKDNRFLAFFTLRYGVNFSLNYKHNNKDKDKSSYQKIFENSNVYGIAKRRFWESLFFGFEYKENRAFKMAIGIFKILNFKYTHRKVKDKHTGKIKEISEYYVIDFQKEKPNQTYLDWIIKYEDELLYAKKNQNQTYQEFYNADARANNLPEKFRNIQGITPNKDNFLSPYLSYLNTLTQKNFSLDNIYCIANYCENLGANKLDNVALLNKTLRQKFEKLEANTPHNILILYPNPTPSIIQIEQPKNTFITLLIGAKAKIDCSKLIEDQCELMYLKYDPTQEEQQAINPQAFSCSTQEELILKKEDEIYFKAVKNNISYFINKNDGILKVALTSNEENAIELYSFAKENQFKILQDKASKMLKIYLKLERYSSEEILSHRGGNFELTLNNLKILDKNGNNHETITKIFLHNCENRRIYESLKLEYQEGIYKSSFKIDLILDENSSFFKRATKCIIATKTLEGFSTSQMHKIGNVAIVSLSSADKKGGSYTFTNKVSMQDFGENLYLDTEANGYEKQIKNSRKNLYITSLQAYKEKEQQNTTDKIPYNETIFVRAYLNNEEKFFFDETIKWAYCIKKEEELECNQSKIKILENLQGNDIAFNTSMLSQDDRNILYNMNEKYQLILFAYFNKPAFKTTQGITHLVLK